MSGRYAKGTSVPMERSRQEVERTLVRYGATGFAYSWERRAEKILPRGHSYSRQAEREVVLIAFKMKLSKEAPERQVRLEVPMPHELELGSKDRAEAAVRQRWRALVLVLKAKLEAVASGISTLESEFLAGVVMPNGRTIGQEILPRLSDVAAKGLLLPPPGGAS